MSDYTLLFLLLSSHLTFIYFSFVPLISQFHTFCHLLIWPPSLPVCGKPHQWTPGADVQVSGGDQHSHPGETGPGGEGDSAGGARRPTSPGLQSSWRLSRLRPEPQCPRTLGTQRRTDRSRRETWRMKSPCPPIIPSPLLLLFNPSMHHQVFGVSHRIKLTTSNVQSVCMCAAGC